MQKSKRLIDILMLIVFLALTMPHIFGDIIHECLGVTFLILVIIHLYLNKNWYLTLFSRKHDVMGIILMIVNFLLLIDIIFIAISGISLSADLFGFIRLGSLDLARRMHVASTYWAYVLIGVHLGLNFKAFVGNKLIKKVGKSKIYPILMTVIFMIALYGGWTFNIENIAGYMFLINHFVDLPYGVHPLLTLFNNFSMIVLWTFLSYEVSTSVRLIIDQKNKSQH